MRVIKAGKVSHKEYEFTCICCGCEFVADNRDRKIDQRDDDYVICPCCMSWINWNRGNLINK